MNRYDDDLDRSCQPPKTRNLQELLTQTESDYLVQLEERLSGVGFSWQHEDYFMLQDIVPKINLSA